MEKIQHILTLLILLTSSFLDAQIVVGEPQKEEIKKEETLISPNQLSKREIDGNTELYFNTNYSRTYRKLAVSESLFGKQLGIRGDEKELNLWSFGLGFKSKLGKYLKLSCGLNYVRNGESYLFTDTDTSHYYESQYRYMGMPIVLHAIWGEKLVVNIGVGLMPQMFLNFNQEQTSVDRKDNTIKNTIKEDNGSTQYSGFVTSAILQFGVQYKYSPLWSIYLQPEMRQQINSTFSKNSAFQHKATAFGFNLGLTYQL
jgi:hypothetical protein